MLIPPTYLRILDPLPEPAARGGRAGRSGLRVLATALVAAASGALAGGITAWLVLANIG